MAEQKAASWETHGVHVLATLERHTDEIGAIQADMGALKEGQRELKRWVATASSILGVLVAAASIIGYNALSTATKIQITRIMDAQSAAVVTMSRDQKIEAIIDAAAGVPANPALRLADDSQWPQVAALARLLPTVHVTRQLRDEACTRVPEACQP